MRVEIAMPHLGGGDEPLTVVSWLKQVGDRIERGEAIAEIETDKSTIELEAFQSGTLAEIVRGPGASGAPGEVIGYLEVET
jgi:pyruvate/2-oxoglutarate dehydrogenase complex dihydrolipoamide acyltransferase (E2) component